MNKVSSKSRVQRTRRPSQRKPGSENSSGSVHVISREWSDAEILDRLQMREDYGAALLYDRYSPEVNRLVWRLLGADSEHDDLVQQVFTQLLGSVRKLRDPEKLRPFVFKVTMNTVRSELRKRAVRRRFFRSEEDPDRFRGLSSDPETRVVLQRTFAALDRMPVAERIAFSLRQIDGRSLEETAELCSCSLATIKRRLSKARKRFCSIAESDPALRERLGLEKAGGEG